MIKIDRLKVNNFRGIRSFEFLMGEKSFVVAGRNGTGKSGVIDALEFAITGSITRLTGTGTGGVSVKSHAAHVDVADSPQDAWVEMAFVVAATGSLHVLKRHVSNPRVFTISPNTPEAASALEWMVQHPEFALTRREIVRFVLAEGKSRADGVAVLLDLQRIGQMRALLVRIRNTDERDLGNASVTLLNRTDGLLAAAGLQKLDLDRVLTAVNDSRQTLGLAPAAQLLPDAVVAGLDSSASTNTAAANRGAWLARISDLTTTLEAASEDDLEGRLRRITDRAAAQIAKPDFTAALDSDALLDSALNLFDGKDCPVCDTSWRPGQFEEIIARKKQEANAAREVLLSISRDAALLAPQLRDLAGPLAAVLSLSASFSSDGAAAQVELAHINAATSSLSSINTSDDLLQLTNSARTNLASLQAWVSDLAGRVHALPRPNEADERRATLRAISHTLHEYNEQLKITAALAEKARRSALACEVFESSTAHSLLNVYTAVQTKFALFYSAINADDESDFSATLTQSGAGLDMNVDFYGRGQFPPGAYHSEGHQDAMGLCLYLALAQFTLGPKFFLCALDDVLMSIDSGHRRFVVALLKDQFPDTQFVVTTHDEQWMRQMKYQSFVQSRGVLQFRTWSVDVGPVDWAHYEPWIEIQNFLDAGQVKAAAGSLRSYLEFIGRENANNLSAPVPFRLDGQNTLGELFNSSVKALRDSIKKGKKSANSWNQADDILRLDAWDTSVQAAAQAAKQEEWAINTVVHFNAWENQTPSEFKVVANSWKDLIGQFACDKCEGLIRMTSDKGSLRCACQHISVNLIEKTAA